MPERDWFAEAVQEGHATLATSAPAPQTGTWRDALRPTDAPPMAAHQPGGRVPGHVTHPGLVPMPREVVRPGGREPLTFSHADKAWLAWGGATFDQLEQRLRATQDEYARLKSRYGPGGTWDAERKAHRSTVELEIRRQWDAEKRKYTEGAVEAAAACDPRVMAWLDNARGEKARFHVLESERELHFERLRYMRGVLYGEAQLTRVEG